LNFPGVILPALELLWGDVTAASSLLGEVTGVVVGLLKAAESPAMPPLGGDAVVEGEEEVGLNGGNRAEIGLNSPDLGAAGLPALVGDAAEAVAVAVESEGLLDASAVFAMGEVGRAAVEPFMGLFVDSAGVLAGNSPDFSAPLALLVRLLALLPTITEPNFFAVAAVEEGAAAAPVGEAAAPAAFC
jgi:hypothetical protein